MRHGHRPAIALAGRGALLIACAAGLALSAPVAGQPASGAGEAAGPREEEAARFAGVLVLNQERLIARTGYGRRIQQELETASTALAAQNRGIEAELTEEELALAELRGTVPAEEFRAMADAFDARVEAIRETQEGKARDLAEQAEAARTRFFERAAPILLDIVRSRGAAVLMDSRAVLLSAESVDITEEAIAALDDRLGDGGDAPLIEIDLQATPD
ncbi:MAG: OmpH family outer membrane protein [Roseicyclus sp.]